ncbi:hypothetical protein BDE02_14G124200 [Populus trichocarpa]|uniref:Phosphoglycerate mutase family protein n=1 Tax=Populus trichocarpa TaxID=3694 RepID=B9IA83_POPTR|nr:hypothetical protein BDE02_14G124200 [Populus trichocarpa]|eukprot:XP_002320431.1 uncharacterized protein LOC7462011 [Populus trichocarpa]
MGSTQSAQAAQDDGEESEEEEEDKDDDEEEEEEELEQPNAREITDSNNNLVKKVLQQEPEMLPCYASASPLSPQLSSLGTPRLGPSIKVWDPYNVLAPPPPPPPSLPIFSSSSDEVGVLEVFLISHGECELNLRPDLVGGRCHVSALTPNGQRQARALAVFFNSQGVSFHSVYSSPLNRARSMAVSVCQEMNFAKEQIQSSDALMDLSMGLWEGCSLSDIYTPEVQSLLENLQPDFCAPSGESIRQVEFRMVQFLNRTVLGMPEKLGSDFLLHHQNESHGFSHDRDGPSLPPPSNWDMQHMLHRHRQGLARKKSGKSRLQFVTTTGNHEGEDEISLREASHQHTIHDLNIRNSSSPVSSCVGVFTHSIPIKCLLTGILGCSPVMMRKICIEDSSVTVLQHSCKTGWQIKRLNDTAHLRLL